MAKRRIFRRPITEKGKKALRQPSPARRVALAMLARVNGPHAQGMEATLDENRRDGGVSTIDASLAQEIARGVCRQRRWLDFILDQYLHHPLPKQAYKVREALLTGVYQALFLDRIPPHTIVDETVKLVGVARTESGYRSLANAVMRRIVSEPRENLLPKENDPWPLRYSVPDWLASEAGPIYPGSQLQDYFVASNEPAALTFRAVRQHGAPGIDELEESMRGELIDHTNAVPTIERGRFLNDAFVIRSRGVAPDHLPVFRRGLITVEDEGAQIAGWLAGARPGMAVLDYCASPGGKCAHLADVGERNFRRFVACDVSHAKLKRLNDTLVRLGLAPTVETKLVQRFEQEQDGKQPDFDLVMVDAPCSALGTLRRHPEVRWRQSPTSIRQLSRDQLTILESAARHVKLGGILVYTVCTFTRQETDMLVEKFISRSAGDFALADAPEGLPFDDAPFRAGQGRWRTATHLHGCDTFFIARFVKARSA